MTLDDLTLSEHGVERHTGLVSGESIRSVISEINRRYNTLPRCGLRNAEKALSSIAALANETGLLMQAGALLGNTPRLVRVILFDKTPEKNWLVSWHQDKTVSVNKKFEHRAWGPWSIKEGVRHVQPPLAVLEQMLTMRIHLDRADKHNGCLQVIPGSHRRGILNQRQINTIVASEKSIDCVADCGDIIMMRPHLLHRSGKALAPCHRRIIHMEFSSYDLPDTITWA